MLMVKSGPRPWTISSSWCFRSWNRRPHHRRRQLALPDTIRRTKYLESKGHVVRRTGVSGGEEGARFGPSMMPGGSPQAWPLVKGISRPSAPKRRTALVLRLDGRGWRRPLRQDGPNGIEYGDIQLICEAYQLSKEHLGMSNEEMHAVFTEWNKASSIAT